MTAVELYKDILIQQGFTIINCGKVSKYGQGPHEWIFIDWWIEGGPAFPGSTVGQFYSRLGELFPYELK